MKRAIAILKTIRDYTVITTGLMFFVAAWSIFLMPNNLMGGGVSGLCAIIYYATGVSIGVSNFVINAVLVIAAMFVLGRSFSIKTIYAIIVTSLGFYFLPDMISKDFITEFTLSNGKLLCTIIGGLMTGLGIGLAFTHGGSTGGTDIVAMMINRRINVSPGKLLLVMDLFIISLSLFVPSYLPDGTEMGFSSKIAVAIYAFVLVGVNSYTVDLYLTGTKQSVQIMVFSNQPETLADAIAFKLKRGVTMLRSRGWYHKKETEVIVVVARKNDLNLILGEIKSLDPAAFISVSSVMGVYGLGFDTIKKHNPKLMERLENLNQNSKAQQRES